MKKILIITGRYLPGFKDGGPVRSIKNLTDYLGDEYDFSILTCDRDHGDGKPYDNIKVNDWNKVGNARVFYVPPKGFKRSLIKRLSDDADIVYVCGCFNDYAINTLLLKRFGRIKKPVVVAAMGLFSPLEFRLKYKKKKLFTMLFNISGMFRKIYWSATSQMEIDEIRQQVRARDNQFFIAEDLPRKIDNTPVLKSKKQGELEIAWISRIAPKKNLLQAIRILQSVRSRVNFTIYGPVHVEDYWNQCKAEIEKLPCNVTWSYKGNVESENVVQTLVKHHVFLFPTLGENYGHVIQEALSAGCACLLSDQTPWKDLEDNNAGYVLALDDTDGFGSAIEDYAQMTEHEFNKVSDSALKYAVDNSADKARNTGYRKIFDTL